MKQTKKELKEYKSVWIGKIYYHIPMDVYEKIVNLATKNHKK